ncbi:Type I site-specific deoxyribonuclease [Vibrio cholerae]|uniref:restriction endonuclease subunit S n=1 Tax=Vibrio cholerae TaxID=666 RepID=UPI0020807874|nr:restriction endonuclease subunit S [Vibrio cholerae]MCR9698383.1 restriction endonuclease subunit S [Vibrio cholerae]GHY58905.1 Type I site-specific deoxyribonuclease [Vibrio cholerae]
MVPNGWTRGVFEDGIELISGQHVEAEYVNNSGVGKPYLTGPADFPNGKIIVSKFTVEGKKFCQKGDLLITVKGAGTGKVIESDDSYAISRQLMAIRPQKFDHGFVFYNLLASISRYEGAAAGLIPGISRDDVLHTPILIPPLTEQKKIAQILSTWDKAITTTEQLLANSQQQKKALMQQLLTGRKRLLDKNGVRFSGEWKFQSISQISKRIQRKSDGEDHPILTISSLSGFVRQDERYSRYMAGESVKNYILLKKGEFAYNKGNSKTYEFGCIFDLDSYKSGLVPHVYVCFKLHQGLSHRYFKYLFEADYLKPQLGALVNTGVRNNGLLNIKPAEFMNTKVPVPCFDEQEQIANVLHASSETINKLQLKLDALKQEKKALMQQLLTGKRRVIN